MAYLIRPAGASDAAGCAAVYGPYTHTVVTFEAPEPDAAEFARRIEDITRRYPWLVCVSEGRPLGYAYAHRFRERAAYDWDTELSVYLAPEATGLGAGTALYGALCELLTAQGFVNAYGTVAVPNPPSERLHEKCGFTHLFTMRRTGWKLGRWLDLAYYLRPLGEYAAAPAPVTPFPELDAEYVRGVCEKWAAAIREAGK